MNTLITTSAARRAGTPWWVAGGLLATAILTGAPALAAENWDNWYIGANAGQSAADIDDSGINDSLAGSGFAVTGFDDDDRDLGYKLFGGYQLNPNFALEGGYFDLGEFSFNADTQPPGTYSGEIEVRGINVDIVGLWPFNEKFSVFGRVGVTYAETKANLAGSGLVTGANTSEDERDVQYKLGAGMQYVVTPALGLRVEAERYRINDAVGNNGDIDLYSVGVIYRF